MILVLDANAVVPNPELQGSAWKDITTAIRDGALSVVVPKIVAAEIEGSVRKNRRDQRPKSDVHRAPEAVRQAVQEAADEVERWAENYDAVIFLEAGGVTILDTPTVPHDEVAQRAIDRIRPFNEKGGGYRDTLHWYTVLDIAREHPEEDLVFVSQDAAYQNSSRDDLHPDLRAEVEAILTTGTITLYATLKEFVPPQKYAGDEDRVFPDAEHVSDLVAALFPDGKLHAPELWIALDLEDPVDADVSEPGTPELVWSFARELVGGGRSYRTRIRMTARVAFDWIDWPDDDDEGSYQELDITAWYTVNDAGFHIDQDRTNLQPAPVYTPPRLDFFNPLNTRTLTSSTFTAWKNQQFMDITRRAADSAGLAKISEEYARRLTDSAGLAKISEEYARRVADSAGLAKISDEYARRLADSVSLEGIGAEIARRRAEGVAPASSSVPDSTRPEVQSDAEDELVQVDDATAGTDDASDEDRQTDA